MAADEVVKRLFTVEEANQRIPLVRVIVQDIVDLFRDVQQRRERLGNVKQLRSDGTSSNRFYSEELDQVEEELQRDEEKLSEFVRELHELGVEFKDPVLGLVDFPAQMDDRVVHLCWKLGEPKVLFWHELGAGFSGRQLLSTESVAGDSSNTDADKTRS
ncbi:MAG: DUF2203 domain-containing protein [Planctomycetota bacterium]|nr:DUF2203 domain-containing protein [Planctomycetota bacterium]MDA1161903.1 DUF2203 domain-containing protein [Planctomycetota bacterium]